MLQVLDLHIIDHSYFNIIQTNAFTITLQSKNTGHYWHILEQDYSTFKSYLIYHRHSANHSYHKHGHGKNLPQIINDIQAHDKFQLSGRKKSLSSY